MNGYVWPSEFVRATVPMYPKLCGLNNNNIFLNFQKKKGGGLCIYFWLQWVFAAESGLSLVVTRVDYTLVVVCGFLIAVASLVAKHGL